VRRGGEQFERIDAALAEAALRLLAERGFADMSVEDVAASAGVSKRTVYRHYPTKVDLAVAAIHALAGFYDFPQAASSARNRLRNYLRTDDERDALFAPVLATVVVNRDTVPELMAAMRERVLKPRRVLIERFIDEGKDSGEIREGVSAEAIAALTTGLYLDDLTGMYPWVRTGRKPSRIFEVIWPLIAAD
jgi:AcrR family transcriptional regulator